MFSVSALGCWEPPPSWKPRGQADDVPGSRAPWSGQVCAGQVGCTDSYASKLVLVTGLESHFLARFGLQMTRWWR